MAKGYGETLVEMICEQIRVRACDPWEDELWPAANTVLMRIADELWSEKEALPEDAWQQWGGDRKRKEKRAKT